MRHQSLLVLLALAFASACAPTATTVPPTGTAASAATITPPDTATPTALPTLTPTLLPTSSPTPTNAPTPTPTVTSTPSPTPTPFGYYVEAKTAGVIHLYSGDIDFSTLPPTEANYQWAMRQKGLGLIRPVGMGWAILPPDMSPEQYRRFVRGEATGMRVQWANPLMYTFGVLRGGSEVMQVPVKLKDGTTKIASVIEVLVTTLDSKGNPIDVLLQLDASKSLYLNTQGRFETFYRDPNLPNPVAGIIRSGDVFGIWATGPFEEFDNARGKTVVRYLQAAIAIYPHAR